MSVVIDKRRKLWTDLLQNWNIDSLQAEQKFTEICTFYANSDRYYHTLDHVLAVLTTVERLAPDAKNLNAVQMAAWLHDVVYDSKAADNEEQSAQYAEQLCAAWSIPDGVQIAALIRKTKTHDAGADIDAQVLLDADLAILGASETVYAIYAADIRREFSWVPEPEYRKGRRQVLEKFLSKDKIFHLLSHLEPAARRNLTAEITRLS